jgi:outer membrane protein W
MAPAEGAIKNILVATSLIGASFVTAAAQAQKTGDYDFKLFVGGAYVQPLNDTEILGETVGATNEFGIELGGEWRMGDRLGFEIAYLDAQPDIEVDGDRVGDIDLKPWNFTLNFHIVDRDAFSWYIGPTLSYINWSNLHLEGGGTLEIDSETTWGASTGFLFGLGDTFGIELGLRYIDSTLESPMIPDEVAVDPLFARVGISFRF